MKVGDYVVVNSDHDLFDLFVGAIGVVDEIDHRPDSQPPDNLILVIFQEANGGRGVWIWESDLQVATALDRLAVI